MRQQVLISADRNEVRNCGLSGMFGRDGFPWHIDGAISSHPPRLARPASRARAVVPEMLQAAETLPGRRLTAFPAYSKGCLTNFVSGVPLAQIQTRPMTPTAHLVHGDRYRMSPGHPRGRVSLGSEAGIPCSDPHARIAAAQCPHARRTRSRCGRQPTSRPWPAGSRHRRVPAEDRSHASPNAIRAGSANAANGEAGEDPRTEHLPSCP